MAQASVIAGLKRDPEFASLQRSLDVYYGNPARDTAMDALYTRFLKPGHLAFDIGSHVGDRIGSFRRLGARVDHLHREAGRRLFPEARRWFRPSAPLASHMCSRRREHRLTRP